MLNREQVNSWISNGPNNELVGAVEIFGREIKDGHLTTSQIRQAYTKVKAIEAKGIDGRIPDLVMLKPLLAYSASRSNVQGLRSLKEVLTMGVDAVVSGAKEDLNNRYRNFCRLFEAILAYHRASGGK